MIGAMYILAVTEIAKRERGPVPETTIADEGSSDAAELYDDGDDWDGNSDGFEIID